MSTYYIWTQEKHIIIGSSKKIEVIGPQVMEERGLSTKSGGEFPELDIVGRSLACLANSEQ